MYLKEVKISNFRIIQNCTVDLQKNVNALVGENNSGKTAIIDAIRLCLGARSYELNNYIIDEDFNDEKKDIEIQCKFIDLKEDEKSKFIPYLHYENDEISLYINLKAQYGKRSVRSTGKNYDGEKVTEDALLDNIICTYLKPLRDAESELSAKKYSRILRILESKLETAEINKKIKEKGKEEGKK